MPATVELLLQATKLLLQATVARLLLQGYCCRRLFCHPLTGMSHGAEMPDGRLAVIGGGVYVAGRTVNHPVLTQVNSYDPATGRWLTLPMLEHARENFGGCCVSDRLRPAAAAGRVPEGEEPTEADTGWWRVVVAGGVGVVGGENNLCSAEAYGGGGQKWEQLPDMPHRAEGCGCAPLPGRRFAAIGGKGVSAAAVYSFVTASWASLPPMSIARCYAGVGFVRGFIVVAGGTGDKMEVHSSVEAMPITGDGTDAASKPAVKPRWRALAALPEARRWCNMVPIHFSASDLAALRAKKPAGKKKR